MTQAPRRIDVGRVIAVSFFALFLSVNAYLLLRKNPFDGPLSSLVLVLTMAFYVLLIWAYLRRAPSTRTDLRWTSWLVAFLATAAPFAIPMVSNGPREDGLVTSVAVAVLAVGLMAMLWALGALGTNISVVPQAREVVSHGPYARVRHPLYFAELVNVAGLCLAATGALPWVVAAALLVLQIVRAHREEALLTRELPGYAAYRASTPMLVPALTRS